MKHEWPLPVQEQAQSSGLGLQSKHRSLLSHLSVCRAMSPLRLQFAKHAYSHLDPTVLVNVNEVGLSGQSIQTWERIHCVHPRDSSMTGVYYSRERADVCVCVLGGGWYELQMWNYWLACYANSMMYYSTLGNMCLLHRAVSYCTMSSRSLKMPIQ